MTGVINMRRVLQTHMIFYVMVAMKNVMVM
jgi:hypothetical protein